MLRHALLEEDKTLHMRESDKNPIVCSFVNQDIR